MRVMRTAVCTAAMILLVGGSATALSARTDVSFDFFYSNLSPHGTWLASASYGHVWQPAVYRAGWNPYYDGRWDYSDLGWTWVSDYAWGAIPYHYGTWALDADLGWVWVPGYVWAPSWVVFREGAGTIGWAPVPPSCTVGVSWATAQPSASAFVFVPTADFAGRTVRRHAVPRGRVAADYRHTRFVGGPAIRNHVVVNRALSVSRVERSAGRSIHPRPIAAVPHAAPFREVTRERIAVPSRAGHHVVHAAQPRWEGRPLAQHSHGHERSPAHGHQGHGHHHGHEKGA